MLRRAIGPSIVAYRCWGLGVTVVSSGDLVQRFEATANEAADDPLLIGFKSIIAYRTGLDVTDPSSSDAAAAFARWRGGWASATATCAASSRLSSASRRCSTCRRAGC